MMFSENMASVGGSEADRKSRKSAANTSVVDNNTSLNNSSDIHDDSAIRKHTPASTSSSTIHWFAQVGSDVPECWDDGAAIDRDERLRMIKDRQNEERQRKLEELKAQAVAAQRYREQKEEERRRRIDDMRTRELDRKQQVDERKRAIEDAEKDRRDYILRRNQERDSRIETKKRNERSSIAFAFGSSTPRLLDPVDVGSMSPSSMWGHRRSTSISNVAYSGAPLSRRSSERELSDVPKKRATSAGGLDRNDDDTDAAHLSYRSVARRKTDLMPTIPSPRDGFGSRSSLYCHTPRTPGSRSGDVTPGTSRPGSALSTSTSVSGVVYRRSTGGTTPRKPRPASIAGTGMSIDSLNDANKLRKEKPPLPRVAMRKSMTSSTNGLHTSGTSTPAAQPSTPKETPKRTAAPSRVSSVKKATPRPMSMSMTASMISGNSTSAAPVAAKSKTPEPESLVSSGPQSLDTASFIITTPAKTEVEQVASSVINEIVATATDVVAQKAASIDRDSIERDSIEGDANTEEIDQPQSVEDEPQIVVQEPAAVQPPQPKPTIKAVSELNSSNHLNDATDNGDIMTASMIKRISTEEEAKAALAERRRLARIEADRLAEIERQRVEAEERAEEQRIAEEEEAQRKFEEETLRLAEAQRKAEELRLAEAIEEAAQREKDEIQRREDEERQKIEREEQERKAREEAERQKIEVAERLKKEEKEREERRKRVEAIMSRTRAKGAAATPNKNDDKVEADKTSDSSNSSSTSETITTNSKPVVEPVAAVVVPAAPVTEAIVPQTQSNPAHTLVDYEKTVTDKENTLINSFSNLIINNQDATELLLHQSNGIAPIVVATPKTNGKALNFDTVNEDDAVILRTSTPATNGNGHTTDHSLDNQIELTTDVVTTATVLVDNNKMQQGLLAGSDAANQLIDFSLDATTTVPQQLLVDTGADDGVLVNFNNNSLTTAGAGGAPNLVTSDSHEHKDISLL